MDESIIKFIANKRVALRKRTDKNDLVVIGRAKVFKNPKGYSIEINGNYYIPTNDIDNWDLLRIIKE